MLFSEPAANDLPWNALDGEEPCKGDAAGNNAGSEFGWPPTLADMPGPCRKLYRMDGTRICPFCGKTFWSSASLSTDGPPETVGKLRPAQAGHAVMERMQTRMEEIVTFAAGLLPPQATMYA